MSTITIVGIALFIPFIIMLGIFAIVFLPAGYKNGLWRSLASLGATVAALLVSILLGKLLGGLLSGPVAGLLPQRLFAELGAAEGLAKMLAQAAIQVVLTLVVYGLFLIIATAVLKRVGKRLPVKKLLEEPGDNKKLRFAGMGIRALDAVVLTFALLLPLYGPVSVALPPVTSMVEMADRTSQQRQATRAEQILSAVDEHPMVKAYKVGPAAAVCKGLAALSIDGERLDLAAISKTVEGAISRLSLVASTDGDQRAAALADLVDYLQKNVVEEGWCYDLISLVRREMEKSGNPEAQEIAKLLNLTKGEFQDNGVALLGFMDYALGNGFMEFYKTSDYESLSPEFYEKLGNLINYSPQAITLKKMFMKESAASLFYTQWDDTDNDTAMVKADEFIEQYIPDTPIDASLRRQEGEMFMRMYFTHGMCNTLEAFARHPLVGYQGTKDLLSVSVLQEVTFFDADLNASPQVLPVLLNRLAYYETAPLRNDTFNDYALAVCTISQSLQGGFFYGLEATDAMLEELLQDLGDEFFCFEGEEMDGADMKALLEKALTEAKETPGVMGTVFQYTSEDQEDTFFHIQPEGNMFFSGGSAVVIFGSDGSGVIQGEIEQSPDGFMAVIK